MSRAKRSVYYLPCKPASAYVNVTDACLNRCLFCVKRNGRVFFGVDLSLDGYVPSTDEIVNELHSTDGVWPKEVVFCGMGEPLLEYERVLGVCGELRKLGGDQISIRIDTSGLAWSKAMRLDVLPLIENLSVSLNAENARKYEELCYPLVPSAFDVLMDFLHAVRAAERNARRSGKPFPRVRLSVVDTSEEDFLPASGRGKYPHGAFPVPDIDECRRIADGFGWPLVVKRLFRDSCDEIWRDPVIQDMCRRGLEVPRCKRCTYRH